MSIFILSTCNSSFLYFFFPSLYTVFYLIWFHVSGLQYALPKASGRCNCTCMFSWLWVSSTLSLAPCYIYLRFCVQINQDRTENPTDRSLLKCISTFFVEMGNGKDTYYYDDYERAILADTSSYYSRLASEWLALYSCVDYIKEVVTASVVHWQKMYQQNHTFKRFFLNVLGWVVLKEGDTKSEWVFKAVYCGEADAGILSLI